MTVFCVIFEVGMRNEITLAEWEESFLRKTKSQHYTRASKGERYTWSWTSVQKACVERIHNDTSSVAGRQRVMWGTPKTLVKKIKVRLVYLGKTLGVMLPHVESNRTTGNLGDFFIRKLCLEVNTYDLHSWILFRAYLQTQYPDEKIPKISRRPVALDMWQHYSKRFP